VAEAVPSVDALAPADAVELPDVELTLTFDVAAALVEVELDEELL
jgi:hypothetical protein